MLTKPSLETKCKPHGGTIRKIMGWPQILRYILCEPWMSALNFPANYPIVVWMHSEHHSHSGRLTDHEADISIPRAFKNVCFILWSFTEYIVSPEKFKTTVYKLTGCTVISAVQHYDRGSPIRWRVFKERKSLGAPASYTGVQVSLTHRATSVTSPYRSFSLLCWSTLWKEHLHL